MSASIPIRKWIFLIIMILGVAVINGWAMPPINGGSEPVYPPGANRPDIYAPSRDESDLEGEWSILVILVDFDDYRWDNQDDSLFNNDGSPYTNAHFNNMLFSEAEFAHPGSENEYTGSMRDYYNEISAGMFTVTGVVTRWYRAPESFAYYLGDNYGTGAYPNNSQRLVEDAIDVADDDVDFSQFDNNDDGIVDALVIVHAGPGAEEIHSEELRVNYIWSHKWSINPQIRDQVEIYGYNMDPQTGTIGVFCHEFGHTLGLPDLYDTDGSSEGIGEWGLMGGGGWNYRNGDPHGSCPSHMCGWSKWYLGWGEIIDVAEQLNDIVIPPVEGENVIYKIWTDGLQEVPQFFLLENRLRIGFDEGLTRRQVRLGLDAPEGLLITHIDTRQELWGNRANADDRQRMVDVEEASPVWIGGMPVEHLDGIRIYEEDDNLYRFNRGHNGDLWPGFSRMNDDSTDWAGERNRDRFGIFTNPSSVNYEYQPSLVEVYDIRLDGENVICSFSYDVPDIAVLMVDEFIFDDEQGGNGNGEIEPGETAAIRLPLRNLSDEDAAIDVSAELVFNGDQISIEPRFLIYPDIPAGEVRNSEGEFIVEVLEDVQEPTQYWARLNISWREDYNISYEFPIDVKPLREWYKYPGNPVLYGMEGEWDSGIFSPSVMVDGDTLRCWYVGANPDEDPMKGGAIGYAWSTDGGLDWHRRGRPILYSDEEVNWMSQGFEGIDVMRHPEGGYFMMFIAYGLVDRDTLTGIGKAVSEDGIAWELSEQLIFQAEDTWADDLMGGQLALFESGEEEYGCAFTGVTFMGMTAIGAAYSENLEDWELLDVPLISFTFNLNDFDGYAALAPDIINEPDRQVVLYTGVTSDFTGRLGIAYIDNETGEVTRHRGQMTGGSVLEPGEEGGWFGEDFLFGGRLFDWHGQRRMLFVGAVPPMNAAAVGLALPELIEADAPHEPSSPGRLPGNADLAPAFPNPFNAVTSLNYSLSQFGRVRIVVYDMDGREVEQLVDRYRIAGDYQVQWSAEDLASGIYFVKLSFRDMIRVQKIILMK